VQVLEDQDEGSPFRHRFEEAPPANEGLFTPDAARVTLGAKSQQWAELQLDPRCISRVRQEVRDCRAQLPFRGCNWIALEDAGLQLDHLGQRPKGDTFAVRERPAVAPVDKLAAALDGFEQLVHEPALPDSGNSDQSHQLRFSRGLDPLERAVDEREFFVPSDQRGALHALHDHAGPRGCCLPHGDRFALAFRNYRLDVSVVDRASGCPVRTLPDKDPVRRGGALDALR